MRLCMLYKIHYGLVAADGMLQLISMQRASGHLNSHAYEVPHSRPNYYKYSFFPTYNKEIEFVTQGYCYPAELGLV